MKPTPTCSELPHRLFAYPVQLQAPINIIEPATTYNLVFREMDVLGYITCRPSGQHAHIHFIARPKPKKLSSTEATDAATQANGSQKLRCLTLLCSESNQEILDTLKELTIEQLAKK